MSSTQMSQEQAVDMKLEVVVLPVSDVDRSKRFYGGLGWRLDADLVLGPDRRVVQFTPHNSECSIHFGKGMPKAEPGSAKGQLLIVADIQAPRAELIRHGVEVSEPFHFGPKGLEAGPDPGGQSYATRAAFKDPDGNGWNLQEIKTRLPGRVGPRATGSTAEIATLTEHLREAEQRHGDYQATAPKHHWSGWYAAYIVARQQGRSAEEAVKDAGLYMEGARTR